MGAARVFRGYADHVVSDNIDRGYVASPDDQVAQRSSHTRSYATITPTGMKWRKPPTMHNLTDVICAHAREITGLVAQGMSAMMRDRLEAR